MHQQLQYIKFLPTSSNQHGVHSPFVYNLVTKCLYNKTNHPEYQKIKAYRAALLNKQDTLEITDFGSGSKIFKSNTRPISRITKTSGTTLKRAKLLFRLLQYLNPKSILELGTNLGIATYTMAIANPEAIITSIEGCPNLSKFTAEQLKKNTVTNVKLINNTFLEALKEDSNSSYDLIFIDGDHSKESTLSYFNQLLPKVHNDTVIIFDDIHWSKEMTEAWKLIKHNPNVTVSIDTFFWGLVFFRKEQKKEHFKIRM